MKKMTRFKGILLAAFAFAALGAVPASAAPEDAAGIPDSGLVSEGAQKDTGEQVLPDAGEMEEVLEEDRQGSVHIVLTDGKTGSGKEGIRFFCAKVADVEDGGYVLLDAYRDSGVDLDAIENSDDLDAAAKTLAEYGDSGRSVQTGQDGEATIEDLEVGVYLLTAEDTESYDTVSPVLIAVPTWDGQEGEMRYDVSVEPKHTPKPDEGRNTAPQTSLADHTREYTAAAAACFLGAALLAAAGRISGKRKGKQR